MCAEEIPLTTVTCEYCDAQFILTSKGYCQNCHQVREANGNGQCKVCGNAVVDLHVESKLIEEPAQKPLPISQPIAQTEIPKTRKSLLPIGILVGILIFAVIGAFLWFGRNNIPAVPSLLAPPTPTATITYTPTSTPTKTSTQMPALKTETSNKPFDLVGVWKSDDLRASDNSWKISNSIYLKFTNTKLYFYDDSDTFNSDRPAEESDIVYINESTFIKKFVYIPDRPEFIGKFQKWTWGFSDGKVLFTIYTIVDSQELALSDNSITAFATGVKVEQ
jgi:hypothetical protein